jgi:excisionase family DNA binding protein
MLTIKLFRTYLWSMLNDCLSPSPYPPSHSVPTGLRGPWPPGGRVDFEGFLTIREAADFLHISQQTLYRLIKKGEIESLNFNDKCIRIPKASLEAFKRAKTLQSRLFNVKNLAKPKYKYIFRLSNFSEDSSMKKKMNSWECKGRKGYFVIRRQYKGSRVIVYAGRDPEEARKALYEFELKVLADPNPSDGGSLFNINHNVSFKDYATRYIEEVSKPFHRSWYDDITRLKAVLPFFRDIPLKQITYPFLKDYVSWRKKQTCRYYKTPDGKPRPIANGTINRELTTVSAILREALRDGIIDKHPLRGMGLKLEEAQKEIHPITDMEEIRKFISHFPETQQHIIRFAFYTGFRLQTVLRLERQRYNPKTREIVIPVQLAKSKKQQIYPLSDEAVKILEQVRNDSTYFFPNPHTGRPYKDLRHTFQSAVQKAGLHPKMTFHDLRRSFGTILMQLGFPLKAVSRAMGHGSITVTERYLRVSQNDIRTMVNELRFEKSDQKSEFVAKSGNKSGNTENPL